MTSRITAPTTEELEKRAAESHIPGVVFATPEESYALFDEAVRKLMNMSADEFIRRWKAGEYDEIADKAGHRHIMYLGGFIPSLECPDS